MKRKNRPVFFDASGKRWKRLRLGATVLLGVLTITLIFAIPNVLKPSNVTPYKGVNAGPPTRSLDDAIAAINAHNTPVIGEGPLIRMVSLEKRGEDTFAFDIFTHAELRKLDQGEVLSVENNHYAIDRYGLPEGKVVALTFDDGPDPIYTPQILDVLSREHVPASFFMIGANVVKYPEVAERVAREGHTLGNHTFTHINFDYVNRTVGEQEINQSEHILRATTNTSTSFMRLPYGGSNDETFRANSAGVLIAQKLGYIITTYDYDTADWKPNGKFAPVDTILDGSHKILLLHDGGGNRERTVAFLNEFIPAARAKGYEFVSLNHLYMQSPALFGPITPSPSDEAALVGARSILVWPNYLVRQLFAVTVVLIFFTATLNIVLATLQTRRAKRAKPIDKRYRPLVSVIVPAFNEEKVLENTVLSVLTAAYKNIEILIVNDGSDDDTATVANRLANVHDNIHALHQRNRGKAAALNYGIHKASGEIIITLDADTLFDPTTIGYLVHHFRDPKIGGVAGNVRVGNIRNMLSRWQALEYITSIALERNAQAFLGAITVVPGACAAWRKDALLAAKGFSSHTLAEDCDIALAVHAAGYKIVQENRAMSHTECPLTIGALAKQRFRWTFGNIQAYWKHRHILFNLRYGWLGMLVIPNAAISLILPILFWPLLFGLTISSILNGNYVMLLTYLALNFVLQLIMSIVGLRLAGEPFKYLIAVPLTRVVWGPLRTYILYRSIATILKGAHVGWNKLARTQTASHTRPAFPAARIADEK